jgi:Ankyrin repeats (many copies)
MEGFFRVCREGDLVAVTAAAPARLTARGLTGALQAVCYGGRRDVVEWFVTQFGVQQEHAAARECLNTLLILFARVAIDDGGAPAEERIRTAQWLMARFELAAVMPTSARRTLLRFACDTGRAEIVHWAIGAFGLGRADVVARNCEALAGACRSGNLELARWLAREFRLSVNNVHSGNSRALRSACARDRVEAAQWLVDEFGPVEVSLIRELLTSACAYGRPRIAQWLVDEVGVAVGVAREVMCRVCIDPWRANEAWHPLARARVDGVMRLRILAVTCGFTLQDLPGVREAAAVLVAKFGFTVHDFPGIGWTAETFARDFGPAPAGAPADAPAVAPTDAPAERVATLAETAVVN